MYCDIDVLAAWNWILTVPDWGNVPAWGALIVATAAGWTAYRSLRFTRRQVDVLLDDRKREEAERLSEQATQFSVWLRMDQDGTLKLHVLNSSKKPIYDVTSNVADEAGDVVHVVRNPIVQPLESAATLANLSAEPTEKKLAILKSLKNSPASAVEVTFMDSANRYWRRDRNGTLRQIDRPDENAASKAN